MWLYISQAIYNMPISWSGQFCREQDWMHAVRPTGLNTGMYLINMLSMTGRTPCRGNDIGHL